MYSSGADVTPEDMNRAYGTRRVAAALAKMRGAKTLPPEQVAGLAGRVRRLCELAKFDLAERPVDYACCQSPARPAAKSYPQLRLWNLTSDIQLPSSGKAVVEYKVRSRESRDDSDGKERFGMGIEIRSIEPVDEDKGKLPGSAKKVDFASRAARLVELAFGDRITAQAGGAAQLQLRTRMANALRAGRAFTRKTYPGATQRAVNWGARSFTNRGDIITGPRSAPSPEQAARIREAWRRASARRGGAGATAGAVDTVAFARLDRGAEWQQDAGWLKLKRADGSEDRVPLRGVGNLVKRNPGKTAAAVAGAGAVGYFAGPRVRALLAKIRK